MASDPYAWSVDQVVAEIGQWAALEKAKRPHAIPDPLVLRNAFYQNAVDGSTLLELTGEDLKSDLNIKQIGCRKLLLTFIGELQVRSATFPEGSVPASTSVQESDAGHAGILPLPLLPLHSKARKKVEPTLLRSTFPAPASGEITRWPRMQKAICNPPKVFYINGTAPSKKSKRFPVDAVTLPGLETGDPLRSEEKEEFDICFLGSPDQVVHASYVYRRLKHMLSSNARGKITHNGSECTVLVPHPDYLLPPERTHNVMLFRPDGNDTIEDAAILGLPQRASTSSSVISLYTAGLKAEFPGLAERLENYKPPSRPIRHANTIRSKQKVSDYEPLRTEALEEAISTLSTEHTTSEPLEPSPAPMIEEEARDVEPVLPSPTNDPTSENAPMVDAVLSERNLDLLQSTRLASQRQRLVREIQKGLRAMGPAMLPLIERSRSSHTRVDKHATSAIVRSAVLSYRAAFHVITKDALRPFTHAIWKSHRHATERRSAARDAHRRIQRLNARLQKLIESVEVESWHSEHQLKKQCESLSETIFAMEREQWQMEVVARSEEPAACYTSAAKPPRKPRKRDPKSKKAFAAAKPRSIWKEFLTNPSFIVEEASPTVKAEASLLAEDHGQPTATNPNRSPSAETAFPTLRNSVAPSAVIVDLTSDGPDADVDLEASLVYKQPETPTRHSRGHSDPKQECFSSPAHLASSIDIESWDTNVLVNDDDEERILVKIFHTFSEEDMTKKYIPWAMRMRTANARSIEADACEIVMNNHINGRPNKPDAAVREKIVKLCGAWAFADPSYFFGHLEKQHYVNLRRHLSSNKTKVRAKFRGFFALTVRVISNWQKPSAKFMAACSPEKPLPTLDVPDSAEGLASGLDYRAAIKQEIVRKRFKLYQNATEPNAAQLQSLRDSGEFTEPLVILNPLASPEAFVISGHNATQLASAPALLEHQIEGLRFLWREIVLSEEQEGCLLAHTMGLGKTRQIVAFLDTLENSIRSTNPEVIAQIPRHFRTTHRCRTLLLCPAGLVKNWIAEFDKWLTKNTHIRCIDLGALDNAQSRIRSFSSWHKDGGVMIMSYPLFTIYTTGQLPSPQDTDKITRDRLADKGRQAMTLEESIKVRQQLISESALVIADEAQVMKSQSSQINTAAGMLKTKSRIALTGTPLSNNLGEYWGMIDWIAPGYLGDQHHFNTVYQGPIERGLYGDSGEKAFKEARTVLRSLKLAIEPKVHRRDIEAIASKIPKKTEFIVTLPLTEVQSEAYDNYVGALDYPEEEENALRIFGWLSVLATLTTHPELFLQKLLERKKFSATTKGRSSAVLKQNGKPKASLIGAAQMPVLDSADNPLSVLALPKELVKSLTTSLSEIPTLSDPHNSYKLSTLLQILHYSEAVQDKVVIFSQYTTTLDFLQRHLHAKHYKTYRIDGAVQPSVRKTLVDQFNASAEWSVFLISTLAGSTGLNVHGANRVVTFDHLFNPAHEDQAVGRVYRLGQTKEVFVYHLSTGGTFEQVMHNTQVYKIQLAKRVINHEAVIHKAEAHKRYIFPHRPVPQEDISGFSEQDPEVLGRILASEGHAIRRLCTTDTFALLNPDEQTDAEREMLRWVEGDVVEPANEMSDSNELEPKDAVGMEDGGEENRAGRRLHRIGEEITWSAPESPERWVF